MRSPVLLLIFNRPEPTSRLMERLRQARPSRLYVAADGPRPERQGEEALCRASREAALRVDWPCEVKTLFRDVNLGCAPACHRAISWFFSHEPEGVVLEDDILPHADFFSFCDALLARFRDDENVMHVNGHNFQLGLRRGTASYYFSRFAHVWGWASWARAWKHYDWKMADMERFMREDFPRRIGTREMAEILLPDLRRTRRGLLGSWAWRWTWSVWQAGGLAVTPNSCLTRNSGFGGGTHCLTPCLWGNVRLEALGSLRHPPERIVCREADEFSARFCFTPHGLHPPSLFAEARRRLEQGVPHANGELIRLLRETYGDTVHLAQLEIYTLLARHCPDEARACLTRAEERWRAPEEQSLLAEVRARLPV